MLFVQYIYITLHTLFLSPAVLLGKEVGLFITRVEHAVQEQRSGFEGLINERHAAVLLPQYEAVHKALATGQPPAGISRPRPDAALPMIACLSGQDVTFKLMKMVTGGLWRQAMALAVALAAVQGEEAGAFAAKQFKKVVEHLRKKQTRYEQQVRQAVRRECLTPGKGSCVILIG